MSYTAPMILVAGKRGTGKTHNMKREWVRDRLEREAAGIPCHDVIFDPTPLFSPDGWHPKGAVYVEGRHAFLAALKAGRFPIVVKKPIFKDFSPLPLLQFGRVLLDEAFHFQSWNAIHPSLEALVCEGRHYTITVMIGTQRAVKLNPVVVTNATRAILLPITHPQDRERIEEGLEVELPGSNSWKPVMIDGKPHPKAREPLIWTLEDGIAGQNPADPDEDEEDPPAAPGEGSAPDDQVDEKDPA